MRIAGRLLEIGLLLKPLMQGAAMRRMAPKLVSIVILSVVTIILGTAVILGTFYVLYFALSTHAFSQLDALLMTLGSAIILLIACILWLRWRVRTLHPAAALPAPDKIAGMVDAFLEGLRGTPKEQ